MKILKFGGTSVGSPEHIQKVIEIIKRTNHEDECVVVVSALGGVTDQLITMATQAAQSNPEYQSQFELFKQRHFDTIQKLIASPHQVPIQNLITQECASLSNILYGTYLLKECSPRTLDLIMSFGERLSSHVITTALNKHSITAQHCDTRTLIVTDDSFGGANVDLQSSYHNIRQHFSTNQPLQVVTGFLGATPKGETTTLGRGGSDYTASLFGGALEVSEIQIWTDVNGVMTADPNKVKTAFILERLRYHEAMELSHFGAKVIHPPTLKPAWDKKIPIIVRNTLNPEFLGTIINTEPRGHSLPITGIASTKHIALLQIQGSGMRGIAGTATRFFKCLAEKSINIILITQASSEYSICVAIDESRTEDARQSIEKEFAREITLGQIEEVTVEHGRAIIAVVGENMRNTPGTSGKIFKALGEHDINVVAIAQGSSELNISIIVNQKDEEKALNVIHNEFFDSKEKTLNLFILGTGLIGSMLLKQINHHAKNIYHNQGITLNIAGIANNAHMLFSEKGISSQTWSNELTKHGKTTIVESIVKYIEESTLPNKIFVDCTASEEIAQHYARLMENKVSVVTPNKKANTTDLAYYKKLKSIQVKHNVSFLYETTVGAGLPIIRTLQDLRATGDTIQKIEGILSGTLSYAFNTFIGEKKFSDIIRIVREKGYSEPDPRIDLSGEDVARKLLTLAREMGQELEYENIIVENLVPESCRAISSVDKFFALLEKEDQYFEQKKHEAATTGKKLRYIASINSSKAQVSLQMVDKEHPFYQLSGSDNIVAFTTERYKETPLVIKGPGAGAEVTAAGVLADILRINPK